MLTPTERARLLHVQCTMISEVNRTPKYRPFHATEDVTGLRSGSIVRSLYHSRWYGKVEALYTYKDGTINAIVRRVCTADGRPYRDTGLAALHILHPFWLEPVSTIPYRAGAWPA